MSSSTSKRQSIVPRERQSGPKAPVNFSSTLTIADSALLTGHHTINISSESVVHPRAKLDSSNGRLTIGRRCIVNERASIGAAAAADPTAAKDETGNTSSSGSGNSRDGVVIGDYVTIETGAVIESGGTTIGEGTVVGVKSHIGRGAKLGKHCTLTPKTIISPGDEVPDFTVVFANGSRRPDKRGVDKLLHKGQARQIDVLRKLIPSNPAKFQ